MALSEDIQQRRWWCEVLNPEMCLTPFEQAAAHPGSNNCVCGRCHVVLVVNRFRNIVGDVISLIADPRADLHACQRPESRG